MDTEASGARAAPKTQDNLCPGGHAGIAQRFSVGLRIARGKIPEGRLAWLRKPFASAVPLGLGSEDTRFLTLKRWAILVCPFGTPTGEQRRRARAARLKALIEHCALRRTIGGSDIHSMIVG